MNKKKELCGECHKGKVVAKGLCSKCYQAQYRKQTQKLRGEMAPDAADLVFRIHPTELEFIKNYFTDQKWVFHPARFFIGDSWYAPDFYDATTGAFIEVVGSRQAYHENMEKYKAFKKEFPTLVLEFRNKTGEICRDENGDKVRGIDENSL